MSRTAKTVEDSFAAGIIEDAKLLDAMEIAFISSALVLHYAALQTVDVKDIPEYLRKLPEKLPKASKRTTSAVIKAVGTPQRMAARAQRARHHAVKSAGRATQRFIKRNIRRVK